MALFTTLSTILSGKAAAAAAGLLTAGTVAAGATDSLPGPAQSAFDQAEQFVTADVDLPDEADGNTELPEEASNGAPNGDGVDPDEQGRDGEQVSSDVHSGLTDGEATPEDGEEFGEAVSGNAEEDGQELGTSVADDASEGNSSAGDDAATNGDDAATNGDDAATNGDDAATSSHDAGDAPEDHPGQDAAEEGQGNRPGN